MNKIILVLFLFGSVSFAKTEKANQTKNCQHDSKTFRCVKYLKNYDGDTITFEIPNVHPILGKKISIRVNGVDTAEIRTKDQCEKTNARTARKLIKSILTRSKSIELRNIQRGKYFRIVADVYADGKSIKDTLVQNNLAVLYDGGTKTKVDWCQMGRQRVPATSN